MAAIADKVLSVAEITREIKLSLEEDFAAVWIEGEISNFKRHTSGHLYFSLKDEEAALRCVLWRATAAYLQFEPEDGIKVRAFGDITVYERQGNYQLRVRQLLPLGVGELEIKFRQLKEKLAAEGLFDPQHKRPLPGFPETVGVVTSPTGAAIRDILVTLRRRWPAIRVVLRPVLVQGTGAAEQITQAIEDFNLWGRAEVLIVGRGGGSLEDLWPFNEEIVARAVYNSQIPIVSAVGHEIDFTICDFVADYRAPTPTAAAERVVPDAQEVAAEVRRAYRQIRRRVAAAIDRRREMISGLARRYGLRRVRDVIFQKMQRVDELEKNLVIGEQRVLDRHRAAGDRLAARLHALSPRGVLRRGYSITRTYPDGGLVTSADQVFAGQRVETTLASGSVLADVVRSQPAGAAPLGHR